MVVLNYKSRKTIEILKYFRMLSEINKLRLAIHLLESKYLHLDIDKEQEIQKLKGELIQLDSTYITTIANFSKYKHLTLLSAQFMELSEYDKNILVIEMLDNIFESECI